MMIALSRRAQNRAQRTVTHISLSNAMGFGFTVGQVIFLLALAYEANDFQMGLLYAAPWLTGFTALFVPRLLQGKETTSIWSRFWWFRTFLCLIYFLLPLVASELIRPWAVVGIYYLFMSSRAFGMAGHFPAIRALAPQKEIPSLMARMMSATQISFLVAQIISFVALSIGIFEDEKWTLYGLIGVGTFFNGLTSYLIGRLPKTGYLEEGSVAGLLRTAKELLGKEEYREVAIVAAAQSAQAVFILYQMSYLKLVAKLAAWEIFMFTVIAVIGNVLLSQALKVIGSRINSRTLLFAAYSILIVMGGLWTFVEQLPYHGTRTFLMLMFVATALANAGVGTVTLQLLTTRLPEDKSVEYSIVYQILQMVASVIAIALVSGATQLRPHEHVAVFHRYSHPFLMVTVLCIVLAGYALFMHKNGSTFRAALATLMPSNLYTIYQAYRIEKEGNLLRRHLALEGIMRRSTHISRDLILENLRSPDVGTRLACFRVLNAYPRQDAIPLLLEEARSSFSPLRCDAITTLGFVTSTEVLDELKTIYADAEPYVQATISKTLARHGAPLDDNEIRRVFRECRVCNRKFDVFIGLVVSGRIDLMLELLDEELKRQPDRSWSRTMFGALAAHYDLRETLFEAFVEEDEKVGGGVKYLIANFEETWPAAIDQGAISAHLERGDFTAFNGVLRRVTDGGWVCAYDKDTALGVLFLVLCSGLTGDSE